MNRLLTASVLAGLGLVGAPAMAQEAGAGVPIPANPTPNELPTGSSQMSDLPDLTFEQAITMARKNNRTIKVDRANLAAAQTATEAAWAALLPNVSAQGKYTRNYAQVQLGFPAVDAMGNPILDAMGKPVIRKLLVQPLDQLDGVISATTPLLAPAAWAGLKSVNANVASAEANFQAQEAELLVNVGEAFLAAAGTDELVEARRSSLGVSRATL